MNILEVTQKANRVKEFDCELRDEF